ncbi:MAG TPA: hypothetical protein VEW26_06625 [Allosphingosinicella sp.]|nr:hypothetical protein [Allosphingosinicella sp.]
MKKLAISLAALLVAAASVSDAQDVAPAVKRKPPAAATAPAPAPNGQGQVAPAAPSAPQPAARAMSERESIAALTAVAGQGGDSALDTSLIRVMGRLVAAGRCGEAASLAARDGRKELASKAQQLCR